jgi:ketosteroid isomerase-like protein
MGYHESIGNGDTNRAAIERMFEAYAAGDWDAAVADFAPDFVQEWPQSGERLLSKAACLAVYRGYPGGPPTSGLTRISGEGDHWTAEVEMHYGETLVRMVAIFEFRNGKVAHETDYFSDPFEPPAWRSEWVTVGG